MKTQIAVALEQRPVPQVPTVVKWAGGKKQLLPMYTRFYPPEFKRYFEPFLGGGAVFFAIQKTIRPSNSFLSDTNLELIHCFEAVRDNLEGLLPLLQKHQARHSKEHFYTIRSIEPKTLSDLERTARFLYLNRTCFNGLYRLNRAGRFNVPLGRYTNPDIVNEKQLREASVLLQHTVLRVASFEDVLSEANSGDFIYLDPPYDPLSQTSSFTTYNGHTFGKTDQERLSKVFHELNRRGCLVMLSNSNTPFIRSLYEKYNITVVPARRIINSKGEGRGFIEELVITNYASST